jgi:imidazole glycerol-phosphate synthase subunit HisH
VSTPDLCIVDYGVGNLGSVRAALRFLGSDATITDQPEQIQAADAIVMPGVGAFGEAMTNLRRLGLDRVLTNEVMVRAKPFLGICLGMQLIGTSSEEMGHSEGLNWIDAKTVSLSFAGAVRTPHVGWSETAFSEDDELFHGIEDAACFYYDHSFGMLRAKVDSVATCDYGCQFVSALHHRNIMATQFHPEKSQRAGLKLLRNFLDMTARRSS